MNKRYFVTYFHGIKHRSLGSHLTLGGHALVRLPLFTEWMTLSKLILTTYKNKILHQSQISQQNDLYQINKLTPYISSVFFLSSTYPISHWKHGRCRWTLQEHIYRSGTV